MNLLGFTLYAIAMPCGVLAAIVVGMQTNSLGMALAALAVVGIGVAGFSTSGLFRKWLWVRR